MVDYFVCSCLFDVVSTLNYDDINELIKFLSVNYLILEHESTFYLCCKDSIDFFIDCDKESVDSCSNLSEPISCLDLICYGFEDVCSKCEKSILKYFSVYLTKIERNE